MDKGRLHSDVGESPDFTLTTALRTWPSRPWSKRSIFSRRHSYLGVLCSCKHTISPTCISRSQFAFLEYRWRPRSSLRYSDLHRFQKWIGNRCRNLVLVSAVSLRPTSAVLFVGIDRILWPIIRWEGVSSPSISSHTYFNGREFKSASTSTNTVESSTKFSPAFRRSDTFLNLAWLNSLSAQRNHPTKGLSQHCTSPWYLPAYNRSVLVNP